MNKVIQSIRDALRERNWYVALFVSLTLPDICSSLEFGQSDSSKYSQWFENNLTQYKGFLSGNDCYALRCALLHMGKDDITDQKKRDVLEHYVFLTDGSHRILFKDCIFDGVKKSFLQLNVQTFCEELSSATEKWLDSVSANTEIQSRLKNTIEVHEPGYTYRNAIKFG